MALVEFTAYDDIRAALGVSIEELEDATLSLPLYDLSLTAELEEVGLDLVTAFRALPDDPGTFTDIQRRFDSALRLFATYAVASHLTVSLPLFSPKEITDGKAGLTRYAQDPYKATISAVNAMFDRQRQRLVDSYATLQTLSTASRTFPRMFSNVVSSTDPVTGT